MTTLSSRYLTHKQASISGCTLFEASVVIFIIEAIVVVSAIVIDIFIGFGLLSFILLFLFSLPMIKHTLIHLGKLKQGKPHGYFSHQFRRFFTAIGLVQLPYFMPEGRLQTRRQL